MSGADLRRVDVLIELRNALLRFRDSTANVNEQLRARIDEAETALARRKSKLRATIEKQRGGQITSRDEREHSEMRRALQRAQEELTEVERCERALAVAVAQYKRALPSWHATMNDILPAAAAFLSSKHTEAADYQSIRGPFSVRASVAVGEREQAVAFLLDHVFDGEINRRGNFVGGHFLGSANFRVVVWNNAGQADKNGIKEGYIEGFDPTTGKTLPKRARSTFFPESWSREKAKKEFEAGFFNSKPIPDVPNAREGISPSGLTFMYYNNSGKIDGHPVIDSGSLVPSATTSEGKGTT